NLIFSCSGVGSFKKMFSILIRCFALASILSMPSVVMPNAFAIDSVFRFATYFNVITTCIFADSLGCEHANNNCIFRSSKMVSSGSASPVVAGYSSKGFLNDLFLLSVLMALFLQTVYIHPAGLSGMPLYFHDERAA